MKARRVSAVAVAILFGVVSCTCVASAHEDEGTPLIITAPSGNDPISCAVFYADNMVYAPQWRLDNYVRIETMVLDMTAYESTKDIWATDVSLYPSDDYVDGLAQQAAIMANSETILPMTKMVSVSYIEITIVSEELDEPILFAAGWDPVTGEKVITVNGLGREVNKAGHVIYGTLWDTTGLDAGVYTIETRLGCVVDGVGVIGEWYSVTNATGHLYNPEAEVEGTLVDPDHPFSDIVGEDDLDFSTYKIGVGGLDGDAAWIVLGPLIPQGPGGGSGGDSGNDGEGGNGNGNCGDGGNGHSKRGK